jgi:hypothetical protein
MYRGKRSGFIIAVALLGLLAATLACGVGTPQATAAKPTVVITFPTAGATFSLGQDVVVQSVAADPQGINRVELWVDGQIVHTQAVVPAVTSYAASQPWKPSVLGSHIIEVRAFNVNNVTNDPVQLVVTVVEAAAGVPTPTPMPGAPDTPTPTPVPPGVDTPTPTTPPTDTPVPATLPYGGAPTIVALVGLNVRSGPGTAYPVIGVLPAGQAARITGQNADGTWWQIVFPPDSGGRGWVSSAAQYGTAYNLEGVPIVETPAPPTYTPTATPQPTDTPQPTHTPTNVPPTPTHTPVPAAPVIHFFQSDHTSITAGQSATLSWDLSNAQWAHLSDGSTEVGVVAPGNKVVAPGSTTTYTLIAHNAAGNTTAQVTITVIPAAVAVHVSGTLAIQQTYMANLDTGTITTSGADIWFEAQTATQRYVTPRNGAKIKKVSSATYSGCVSASSSLSTSKINITSLPAGSLVCVRTSEGRLAGFRVNSTVGASPGTLHISFTTWD